MKRILSFLLLTMFIVTSVFAAATRVLDGAQITNGAATLTLPTSTDTILGRATSDTLTNKTMSGASNTFSAIPVGAIGNGSVLSGSNTGDVTIGTANGLSLAGQALSLQLATTSLTGALSSTDWNTFNNKLGTSLSSGLMWVGNASNVATATALSGDVTISNTGSVTIGAKKVQVSKIDSAAATNGYVLTADGSGGASFTAPVSTAPGLSGTFASPTAVTAAGGVSFSGTNYTNYYWVTGSPGAVTVTANPQVTAGTNVGQRLVIFGGANTVTLADGNGLNLNGSWVGGTNSALELVWSGTAWQEESRR